MALDALGLLPIQDGGNRLVRSARDRGHGVGGPRQGVHGGTDAVEGARGALLHLPRSGRRGRERRMEDATDTEGVLHAGQLREEEDSGCNRQGERDESGAGGPALLPVQGGSRQRPGGSREGPASRRDGGIEGLRTGPGGCGLPHGRFNQAEHCGEGGAGPQELEAGTGDGLDVHEAGCRSWGGHGGAVERHRAGLGFFSAEAGGG
mmetsp:Transcript_8025/g.17006  ORF Transcript_8025/g.17006 Transcript_8025/m.17006 type:complete len:206 (+) Transcript_8025:941-1558(+)